MARITIFNAQIVKSWCSEVAPYRLVRVHTKVLYPDSRDRCDIFFPPLQREKRRILIIPYRTRKPLIER
jgi:hypothetical protein